MDSPKIIGIDNGSTGTIAIVDTFQCHEFFETPTIDALHYGKRGSITKRLDRKTLREILSNHSISRAVLERPFTGKFINAVLPAHRLFEATVITLEDLGIGIEIIDSRQWQESILGNVKGSAELKKASALRGAQLYPQLSQEIKKHGDADGLLIAHWYIHKK